MQISVTDSLQVRVELGKQLFFDKSLSRDFSLSCASCHKPELAFSDNVAKSKGFDGRTFLRNSPSLLNAGVHPYFFADGGAPTLETQALQPIQDEHEMNVPLDQLAHRIRKAHHYDSLFLKAFGKEPDERGITHSLAAYVKTLKSRGSKWDKFLQTKDSAVFSINEKAGFNLFFGKAQCGTCHSGPYLSNFQFYDVGTGSVEDLGRERITLRFSDRYKFKTPILRNLSVTYPYFHNGSMETLDGVIDHFSTREKLNMTTLEKKQLISFLESLTDSIYLKSSTFAAQ